MLPAPPSRYGPIDSIWSKHNSRKKVREITKHKSEEVEGEVEGEEGGGGRRRRREQKQSKHAKWKFAGGMKSHTRENVGE